MSAVVRNRTVWLVIAGACAAVVGLIAIPNLKLGRMTANEASAKRSVRIINSAEIEFAELHPDKGYACSLATLGEAHLVPTSLASGEQKGYVFEMSECGVQLPSRTYRVFVHAAIKNQTGYWVFCSDQTGTVKGSPESMEDCLVNGVIQH